MTENDFAISNPSDFIHPEKIHVNISVENLIPSDII